MRRDHASGEAGFTVVEALVAATILITGVLATLALVDRATGSTSSSKQRDVANSLAQELVERAQGGRYTTTRNDMTDIDAAAANKGPADRLRAALDPDGDSASSTIAPATPTAGVPLSAAQTWTLVRKNTTYTVSYRACTSSDVYQQVEIKGPFDCERSPTDPGGGNETVNGDCRLGLTPPTAADPPETGGVTVNLQILGLTGLTACVAALNQELGDGVCDLLGTSTLLDGIAGDLLANNALLPQLLGGVLALDAETCSASQVEAALAGARDGIASATRMTVTVGWTDTDRRAQSITQTAIVRRPAS